MVKFKHSYIFHLILFLIIITSKLVAQDLPLLNDQFNKSSALKREQSDSLIANLKQNLLIFEQNNDTTNIISCRKNLLAIYAGRAEFSNAYEEVWKVLPLCDAPKYIEDKFAVINRLIGLFLLYDQYEKAIDWHQKLSELIEKSNLDQDRKTFIRGRIFTLGSWIEIRANQNYSKAEKLSKKAIEEYKKLGKQEEYAIHHTTVQLGNVYLKKGQLNKAFQVFAEELKKYPLPEQPLHALLFFRIGEYYSALGNTDSVKYYFTHSLEIINQFNTLSDKKPMILEALSKINAEKGNYRLAYEQHKEAALLNEIYYSSQQAQNRQLFEIKDQYHEQLKEQEEQIKEQQLSILTKENALWQLRAFSIILSLAIITIFVIIVIRRKAKRDLLTQTQINVQQKMELKKQEEVLEFRNKELLSSAMQLLERENEQAEIKKVLDKLELKGENATLLKQLKNDLKINKSQKWEEFESRFIAVNDAFFSRLKESFPRLTPTDLKMCAFIKLGFSSKDMAQIMGITVEGINTTRSRLRKKMNLSRNTILTEFLQSIENASAK